MKNRTHLITTGVLAVAIVAGYATFRSRGAAEGRTAVAPAGVETNHDVAAGGAAKPRIAGLKTAVAVAGEGWEAISATGRVTVPPDRLVKVTPRIAGKVVDARGTVGDAVRRGQVLAVISSVDLAEARSRHRLAVAKLRATEAIYARELEVARLGATSARPLEEARTESLSAQGELADARSEWAQSQSDLSREETELAQCQSRLDRSRSLYASEIVSRQDVESAEAEFRRDTAAVDKARSVVNQAEARIEKATRGVELARQYLVREEKAYRGRVLDTRTLQAARNEISGARIEVQAAGEAVRVLGASPTGSGDTIAIVSPIAGRIIARTTNVGEMASPEESLFTVANLEQVWVEADVFERDLARVRNGQTAEIRVEAYPDRVFAGRVESISDVLSPDTRTAKVRCVVANSQRLLRGEMFARATLVVGKRSGVVLVPRQAVLDESGKKVLFTPCTECDEDKMPGSSGCGSYDKVEVATGPLHGNDIEVRKGIGPGTEVVTAGAYQILTAMSSGTLEAGCADGH